MNLHIHKLRWLLASTIATAAMTVMMMMAPKMGMPPMDVPGMLAGVVGGPPWIGLIMHLMMGWGLGLGYIVLASDRLPGPPFARGMLFAMAPWLMAQLVVMPMMGQGIGGGSLMSVMGSLMGHLLWGGLMGQLYGHDADHH
jgi:uncharacterized membrane protein YagU involved in acid resistance